MSSDLGTEIKELRVDGGASSNDFLMQFQSDILGIDVIAPEVKETTALGAAYLAGLGIKLWESVDDIQSNWKMAKRYTSDMNSEKRTDLSNTWSKAVERSKKWNT